MFRWMDLYFSERFEIPPRVLEEYGALDISVASDLPLFIDPFLLFNSDKPAYQHLHDGIMRYLTYLRDLSADRDLDKGLIDSLYRFKEVKQNWLGYTVLGNGGQGLGADFAEALHGALSHIFADFGRETITRGTHLEKLCLIKPGVGKDNISDFTANLIKGFLCRYTEQFARQNLAPEQCDQFRVSRARFNYQTGTWVTESFHLPRVGDDYVILTPLDLLTRDDTWINHKDMIRNFARLPAAVPNDQLRAQINAYFRRRLGSDPDAKRTREAAAETVHRFPELIDRYIRMQEDEGDRAESISAEKVEEAKRVLVEQVRLAVLDLERNTKFYDQPWTSYEECLERARYFKTYIESKDGYRLLNRGGGGFSNEKEVQLVFGLVWCKTEFDVNREPNNGRGPVDFKVSYGAGDKSLIEFKLASNTQLKRNLEKQIAIYEAANQTRTAVKVIVCYSGADEARLTNILDELGLAGDESILVIDARSDNKPSASKA
jgi:hypothetical protein